MAKSIKKSKVERVLENVVVSDRDNTVKAISKPKRNLERFLEATGKTEADYEKWATEVGQRMHIGTLDRLICEKFGVYMVAHLIQLPSEFPDDFDYNDMNAIVDNTSNPYELAKMLVDTKGNAANWSCKESILNEKLAAFPKEDFERWGDKNCLSDVSKKWFDSEGIHLDVKMEIISTDSGIEITTEDAIDFVKKYKPNAYKNPMQVLLVRIEERFKEVTTFKIKDYYAEHLIKACEFSLNTEVAPF